MYLNTDQRLFRFVESFYTILAFLEWVVPDNSSWTWMNLLSLGLQSGVFCNWTGHCLFTDHQRAGVLKWWFLIFFSLCMWQNPYWLVFFSCGIFFKVVIQWFYKAVILNLTVSASNRAPLVWLDSWVFFKDTRWMWPHGYWWSGLVAAQ